MQNTVFLQLHTLSPTPTAASDPSKHVYLQLQELVVTTDDISPLEWGWESVNGQIFPIRTVGCGDCKGFSCSNSNLKNVTDTDMTEDL